MGCLNVESAEELELVARVAAELRRPASLALRVNPDVDAGTHRHTTTGTRATKFGVSPERVRQIQHDGLSRLKQLIAARGVRKDALL